MTLRTVPELARIIGAMAGGVVADLTGWTGVAARIGDTGAELATLVERAVNSSATAVTLTADAVLIGRTHHAGARIGDALPHPVSIDDAVLSYSTAKCRAVVRMALAICWNTYLGRGTHRDRARIDARARIVAIVDARLLGAGDVWAGHAETRVVDTDAVRAFPAERAQFTLDFSLISSPHFCGMRRCRASAHSGASVAVAVAAAAAFLRLIASATAGVQNELFHLLRIVGQVLDTRRDDEDLEVDIDRRVVGRRCDLVVIVLDRDREVVDAVAVEIVAECRIVKPRWLGRRAERGRP